MSERENSQLIIVDTSTNGLESEYFKGNGVKPSETVLFVEFPSKSFVLDGYQCPVYAKGTIIDISA
jgi:hypothetical protein